MLRFGKATNLSLLFQFFSSVRLSNSLSGSDVLLFLDSPLYNFFSNFFCSIQRIYDLSDYS